MFKLEDISVDDKEVNGGMEVDGEEEAGGGGSGVEKKKCG